MRSRCAPKNCAGDQDYRDQGLPAQEVMTCPHRGREDGRGAANCLTAPADHAPEQTSWAQRPAFYSQFMSLWLTQAIFYVAASYGLYIDLYAALKI